MILPYQDVKYNGDNSLTIDGLCHLVKNLQVKITYRPTSATLALFNNNHAVPEVLIEPYGKITDRFCGSADVKHLGLITSTVGKNCQ